MSDLSDDSMDVDLDDGEIEEEEEDEDEEGEAEGEEDDRQKAPQPEQQVHLKSSDGKRFSLTKSQASCSNALKSMMESSSSQTNHPSDCINLDLVHSKTLSKIVDWCQAHARTSSQVEEWDRGFIKSMTEEEMLTLMHAANYLDVRGLLDTCCSVLAKKWEGMKVEEIRRLYNIESDYAPEEEHQMALESKRLGLQD